MQTYAKAMLAVSGFLAVFVALLWLLPFPTNLQDCIRHAAVGMHQLQGMNGWGDFLYGHYLNLHNGDLWWLSHHIYALLAPLGMHAGLDVYIVVTTLLLTAVFLLIAYQLKLPWYSAVIYVAILLFAHRLFTTRLLMARPLNLVVIIFVLHVYATLNKKYVWSALTLATATLLSLLFVFPLIASLVTTAWWALRKHYQSALRLFVASVAGAGIGLVLHPHTTGYIHYLLQGLTTSMLNSYAGTGAEFSGGLGYEAIILCVLAWCLLACVYVTKHRKLAPKQEDIEALGLLCIGLSAAFVCWNRSIEFLWPLLVLLLMYIQACQKDVHTHLWQVLLPKQSFLSKRAPLLIGCLCAVTFASTAWNFAQWNPAHDLSLYEKDVQHIQKEPVYILNTDVNLFSILFYLAPQHTYARGLDTSLSELVHPGSSELFARFDNPHTSNIERQNALSRLLKLYPDTKYVVSRHLQAEHVNTLKELDQIHQGTRLLIARVAP